MADGLWHGLIEIDAYGVVERQPDRVYEARLATLEALAYEPGSIAESKIRALRFLLRRDEA